MHQTNSLRKLSAFFLLCTLFIACGKPKDEKQNQPPGSFTVSVSNVTFNSASLNWTAATDPENQAVTYTVSLDGQTIASNLSGTTHSLTNLQKNKAYTGTVKATDAAGLSSTANFSFNTSDSPAPSDFTLKVDANTNKSITVSWTASTLPNNEPVQYDVYVGAAIKAANITQTQYVASGLTPNTSYSLKVVAKSADGKSTEKTINAQTGTNSAPTSFSAQEVQHGFSFIKISWNGASDVDNDSLSYFLDRNGTISPLAEVPVNGVYSYVLKNLSSATAYSLKIVAKDAYGGEISSNTVQVTTKNGPEENFVFTAKNSGNDVHLEWLQSYTTPFDPSASSYFINGVEKSLSNVQISTQVLSNNKLYAQVWIPGSEFPNNTQRSIKLKLNWGANESTTQSRTVNHTRYTFSATTASVASATLKTFSNGDRGYVLTFTNDIISEHSAWTVKEVKFDDCIQPGSISLQFPSGQTVSSVFGNLSESDYQYLKTKSNGYIVVEDAGGFHRLNFTFTVQ